MSVIEKVWKLRLRESRTKLAWVMPSVSNLDKVKDGKMNSRGFSNPWDKDIYIHLPSAKTGIGGTGCRSASLQTHFPSLQLFPRVQEPAAIRPSGFPSFRRFSLKNE